MKTSAKGIYSETLQSIIDAKLVELVKKRDTFEARKAEVLGQYEAELDEINQLQILLDGVKRCFQIKQNSTGDLVSTGTNRHGLFDMLINLERFLEQPRYDASVSKALLSDWRSSLLDELEAQSARYEYASLYARLVTDWLTSEKGLNQQPADDDLDMSDNFEELESGAKLDSRREWEESVFNPVESPVADITGFLARLFGENDETKEKQLKGLESLRTSVTSFETQLMASGQFNGYVINWCIDGLVANGRLDNSKLQVLKDFQKNEVILSEVSDVLNLRMANIENWSWGESVPVEQRRRLAGNYSNEMNEDLLQAIFLQYIGTKWAVFFRTHLAIFADTKGAWKPALQEIPNIDRKRRHYYLGGEDNKSSLQAERHRVWRSQFFLSQLPRNEWQKILWTDGEEEADYGMQSQRVARRSTGGKAPRMQMAQMASGAKRQAVDVAFDAESDEDDEDMGFGLFDGDDGAAEDYGDHDSGPRNLMELKQRLLHLLQAEILINRKLHGKLTAFRGQFQKWDATLPHDTIMAVLSFFGVSEQWQKFFNSFLKAPLSFSQSGSLEAPRKRQRGVPERHPLSDTFGEVILFCMDLLINQECDGAKLWRIHDDFWFWSPDSQVTTKAWTSINKFSKLFGTSLDEDKAGAVHIGDDGKRKTQDSHTLPKDPIQWGFLYLDSKTGEFDIDHDMVDSHVDELKRQLHQKASKGVMSWIEAWNTYAITFFSTNFGKPAYCFGPDHMKKILLTLDRMQKRVFDGSNMVQFVSNTIKEHYNVSNVPDGYVYFPTQIGGLDLRNPFVIPLQLDKRLLDKEPNRELDEWHKSERNGYEAAKERFDKKIAHGNKPFHGSHSDTDYTPKGSEKDTFFSFEEYVKYREDLTYPYTSIRLSDVYRSMLGEPTAEPITLSHDIRQALTSSSVSSLVNGGDIPGASRTYWLWMMQVYGPEIIKKFGGMNIVDPGVLPIGMVGLLKGDRVEWN